MLTASDLSSQKKVIKEACYAFFENMEMSGIQAEKSEAGYDEIQLSRVHKTTGPRPDTCMFPHT